MQRPSVSRLGEAQRSAAARVAKTLGAEGHRVWLVGGAVRDLALGRTPADLDLASSARPELVEARFERTIAVGRAFGTLILSIGGVEMQHTTFRRESSYSDARRPDAVEYGDSLANDAARRDFTCNALYLDPLDDTLEDPTDGLEDLRLRRLRTVGDPHARFREDGLRLLRLARLASAHGLEVEAPLVAAARQEADALRGVSPERVLQELERILDGPDPFGAVRILAEAELLERILPGVEDATPTGWDYARACATRLAALERLGEPLGQVAGLAMLLSPLETLADPCGSLEAASDALARLRPSRALAGEVGATWGLARALAAQARAAAPSRAQRIRLVREPAWPAALRYALAQLAAAGADERPWRALERFAAELARADLRPEPLLASADLRRAGVEPGERFGRLLRELEDAQLEGQLHTRDEALAWLARRAGEEPGG